MSASVGMAGAWRSKPFSVTMAASAEMAVEFRVRTVWRVLLWLGIIVVMAVAGRYGMSDSASLSNYILGAAVLLLTGVTLDLSYLQGPKLVASKPDELGIADIVFFANPADFSADFLVQVHAAVANVGGRSAVITMVKLVDLQNGEGKKVLLPNTPVELGGTEYRTWDHWMDTQEVFERTITPPPFVLAPDGVMVFRFRAGRGIEWGAKWTREAVQQLRDTLSPDIRTAVLEIGFREGQRLRRIRREVTITTEGLPTFLDVLSRATKAVEKGSLPLRQPRVD